MATNRSGTVTAKFAEFLVGEGYVSQTIKAKYVLAAALSRWLKRRRVTPANSTRRGSSSFMPIVAVRGEVATYVLAVSCTG
jgi:hypothetical protein